MKESLLFQPHPQKSCKVLEGEKIYDLSTYFSIIQHNKKIMLTPNHPITLPPPLRIKMVSP